ncbi:Fatty acid hydroxylase family (carotene hydroxylase/sterol desaturase) [hydrothermal vent metagenome]|uniref:Fatty acid hydroxylase family (Carotene hydroxylase/sterol desaturase) n=1 Tax=hydrothermal vent metagenome TaxID=652676 RepID=A0A3B0RI46_9ZZZZ
MPENLPDINVSSLAGPLYVILILLEIIAIKIRGKGGTYEAKDAAASIFMGAGSAMVNAAYGVITAALFITIYNFAPVKIPFSIWSFAACFVLWDLTYYWAHRYYHRSRWGWAAHVIHHSSQHYNLSTALRQSWTGFWSGAFVLYIPLALLGFHPALIVLCGGLNLIYQFWFHTEFIDKCPKWFEAVMNTPSHHRVHHAKNPRYLDANYAGVFIIWDKMFGTFVPELKSDAPDYGLVSDIGTFNPLRIFSHEYVGIFKDITQSGLSLWQRILYVFAPPGWCHDGSRTSSEQIKQAFVQKHPKSKGNPGLPD